MVRIIKTFLTEKTGIGRDDYSSEIEISSAPMIRKHQTRTSGWLEFEFTLNPGEICLVVSHLAPKMNKLVAFSDIYYKLSKNILVRTYWGVMDLLKFINTPMTEQDVLNCTVLGKFQEHFSYGGARFNLKTPVTFYVDYYYYYAYIFFVGYNEQPEDASMFFDLYCMDDKYVR